MPINRSISRWLLFVAIGLCFITTAWAQPRIVTLAPSATEMVYAAGAGDAIVATVRHSDYPPEAKKLPHIGSGVNYSDEAIIAQQPTLVVGWQKTQASQRLAKRLAVLGVPIIYVNPQSLAEIPQALRRLGKRLQQPQAASRADALQARIDALTPPKHTHTALVEIGHQPLFALAGDALINDALAHCGLNNVFANHTAAAIPTNLESVLAAQPDMLIMATQAPAQLDKRQQWWAQHGLAAAQHGQVINLNPDAFFRAGPRIVDATEQLCRAVNQAVAQTAH